MKKDYLYVKLKYNSKSEPKLHTKNQPE